VAFFSQVIVPRLCDFLLNKSLLARHRRALLTHAHGDVLEIGFGTGLNLPHYPSAVRKVTAVDPNPGMHRLAQQRVNCTALRWALERSIFIITASRDSHSRLPT
jgi:SAM-dependent methyltransferase